MFEMAEKVPLFLPHEAASMSHLLSHNVDILYDLPVQPKYLGRLRVYLNSRWKALCQFSVVFIHALHSLTHSLIFGSIFSFAEQSSRL